MRRLSDSELAELYRWWDDATLREHYEASRQEARVQYDLGDRKTAQLAQACRLSAHRYSREVVRRANERGSK